MLEQRNSSGLKRKATSETATLCCGSVIFVRSSLVEVEVPVLLAKLAEDGEEEEDELLFNVGDEAAEEEGSLPLTVLLFGSLQR